MTKAQLIAAFAGLADDAEILIQSWPSDTDDRGPGIDDLYTILDAMIIEADGPGAPAFGEIRANVEFVG